MATANTNTKRFVVRAGFVLPLSTEKTDGQGGVNKTVKVYDAGDEVNLNEEQYLLHAHKVEFANQKDRDAALAAEKEAQVAKAAQNSPAELVQLLTAALTQALQGAGVAAPQPEA